MSGPATVEHNGVELARLLVPLVDGEPKYRRRLVVLSVNETYGRDSCLIEVPADDPNVQWALQDPGVVRYDYDGNIIDWGRNGPAADPTERVAYTRRNRRSEQIGGSIFTTETARPADVQLETVEERDVDESDLPRYIRASLAPDYDLSDATFRVCEGSFAGEVVPVRRIEYFTFPNAGISVTSATALADEFSSSRFRIYFNIPMYDDLWAEDITVPMFAAPPKVFEAVLPMMQRPYVEDDALTDRLPPDRADLRWYKIESPIDSAYMGRLRRMLRGR